MAFESILSGASIASTAIPAIGSFAQASEQNRKMREAEEAAAAAMLEARKRLEVNYYEGLGIQKEPYELARRELLTQGAMATEALKEGDARSLAAGVGRVQLAQQAGQEKVATAMQQEKAQLDKLIAAEEGRLADIGSQLYLQEAIGAQEAAADAQRAEAQAIQQGFSGVTRLGRQLVTMPELYGMSEGARAAAGIDRDFKQNLNKEQRADRKELRQEFKEELRNTPKEDRKNLREQFRDDMRGLRETQSSVQADTFKNVLSNVDISSLNLSPDAKAILTDPTTKRVRNPEELSENEFKAFTDSLSLPVLQGIRKFAGLDVSTRGRNPNPSDIGMRQFTIDPINPITNIPAEEIYNIPAPPLTGTPNVVPSQLMQQMSLMSPLVPFDAFDLFNIYTK